MGAFDLLFQLIDQIADGRTLYRYCQVQKQNEDLTPLERREWLVRASETDDDVDTLVRQFRALSLRIEAEIAQTRMSEARLSEQVKAAQERIAARRVA
jgi:hypothetical protein